MRPGRRPSKRGPPASSVRPRRTDHRDCGSRPGRPTTMTRRSGRGTGRRIRGTRMRRPAARSEAVGAAPQSPPPREPARGERRGRERARVAARAGPAARHAPGHAWPEVRLAGPGSGLSGAFTFDSRRARNGHHGLGHRRADRTGACRGALLRRRRGLEAGAAQQDRRAGPRRRLQRRRSGGNRGADEGGSLDDGPRRGRREKPRGLRCMVGAGEQAAESGEAGGVAGPHCLDPGRFLQAQRGASGGAARIAHRRDRRPGTPGSPRSCRRERRSRRPRPPSGARARRGSRDLEGAPRRAQGHGACGGIGSDAEEGELAGERRRLPRGLLAVRRPMHGDAHAPEHGFDGQAGLAHQVQERAGIGRACRPRRPRPSRPARSRTRPAFRPSIRCGRGPPRRHPPRPSRRRGRGRAPSRRRRGTGCPGRRRG